MRKGDFVLLAVKDTVFRRYTAGESLAAIAAAYHVSETSVHRLMKRFGVVRRPRSEANKLFWTPEEKAKRRARLVGKPSPARGKHWTYGRIVKRPKITGENNGSWKGGRTALAQAIRTSVEYRFWRDAVFRRDDYTCQSCGMRSAIGTGRVHLNADHVIPLSLLLERFLVTNTAEAVACAALWHVDNGLTLCHACHRLTETYGRNLVNHGV